MGEPYTSLNGARIDGVWGKFGHPQYLIGDRFIVVVVLTGELADLFMVALQGISMVGADV
jgi:hypothetical protein